MNQKVLVTGAAGFIGGKVATAFLVAGYEVVGWDRVCKNKDFEICQVDLLDEEKVTEALKAFSPDIVIHCAGSADVGNSVIYPSRDYEGNVTVTHNLLFSLHSLGMDGCTFVFLSSAGVYGNPVSLPVFEDFLPSPLSPYAVHKLMCEDLCKYFVQNYKMRIKIARIFSAYGRGLKKQIFWDMYKKWISTGQLNMFGTGKESRDYIHVDDIVRAIYLLATTGDGIVFNVANGEEITINYVTRLFAEKIGAPYETISFNGVVREGDPLNWKADITKIQKLGYVKSVELSDGIEDYVNWVKEQGFSVN